MKALWTLLMIGILSTAQAADLASIRSERAELVRILQTRDAEIGKTSARLSELSDEIHRLKQKGGMLADYKLRRLLKEAQEVSNQLEELKENERRTQASLAQVQKQLLSALASALENHRAIANSKTESLASRRAAAREMDLISLEKLRLMTDRTVALPTGAKPLLGKAATDEEARDRLNAIRDFERSISREKTALEAELTEVRKQRFMRTELSRLMEEESFFGEQGFVRGGPVRTDKASASTLAKSDTKTGTTASSTATPAAGDVATAASPGRIDGSSTASASSQATPSSSSPEGAAVTSAAPEPVVAATGPAGSSSGEPSDALGPSAKLDTSMAEVLRDSRSDLGVRDPLAQLASEFGIRLQDLKDASVRQTGDGLSDQIRWLENRLSATRSILERLEERARTLEQRLRP